MNIGIDVDDTISNTIELLIENARKFDIEELNNTGEVLENNQCRNHKHLESLFNWTEQEQNKFWDEYYIETLANVKPKEMAKETIKKIREDGNKVIIVTARFGHESIEDITLFTKEWLDKNEIEYDEIITNAQNKAKICKDKDIHILIDDSYENCKRTLEEDIGAILVSNKYNSGIDDDSIKRASTWEEIYEEVCKHSEYKSKEIKV